MNTGGRYAGALAAAAVTAVALSGCAPGHAATSGVSVVASFYPLQFVVERVGGADVDVQSLTPAGAEPHDLELTTRDVLTLENAELVLTLSGFQPALDDALAEIDGPHVVDTVSAERDPLSAEDDTDTGHDGHDHHEGQETETEVEHEHDDHGDREHEDHEDGHAHDEDHGHAHAHEDHGHTHAQDDGHGHTGTDPHFWLDPTRLAGVAGQVAEALSAIDPEHAATYTANAADLVSELTGLDEDFAATLDSCAQQVIVVSHEAYGYLAARYGFEQVGIAGLDPENEPSPARLQQIAQVIRSEGVSTIFTESLVNPHVAEALAHELDVTVQRLDPLETRTDPDADYLSVMRTNLSALTAALECA